MPKKFGEPVLSDFGAAVHGDVERTGYIQPDVYRAPEVCLQIPWSYGVDIWNLGVLVCGLSKSPPQAHLICQAWMLYQGQRLFTGMDPIEGEYRIRAMIAEMIARLGPPPTEYLKLGKRSSEFFTEDGEHEVSYFRN